MLWCPKCKVRVMAPQFPNGHCPQCREKVSEREALTSDPYKPTQRRSTEAPASDRFLFDQRGGSDTDGQRITIPTDVLGFYRP